MLGKLIVVTALAAIAICAGFESHAVELKPYKERLFAYPEVLKEADSGDYRVFDYQELRDINARDQDPERRVQRKYIDYAGRRGTKTAKLSTATGSIQYYRTGQTRNARIITVYIHGKGGNGKQGVNDFSFGGNFNRIKMLMIRNRGLYLSPDAGNFGDNDAQRVKAVIEQYLQLSPNAKFVLACGSAGGQLCYRFADDAQLARRLIGIMLLGSFWDNTYPRSDAGQRKTPIYIGHGSRDTVFDVGQMEAFYQSLRSNGIPARFARFETGTHGTPIRMVDWREAINWIVAN